MSWVANVLVTADRVDTDVIRILSEWLRTECPWRVPSVPPGATGVGSLEYLSDRSTGWGGGKYPECNLWAGALNHADLVAVRDKVHSLPWRYPSAVQLLIQDQEQDYFRLFMIRDGDLREFSPPPLPLDRWDEHHAR